MARAAQGEAAVYGVNTGFGKLASLKIAPKDTAKLQENLILSHCCGVGEPLAPEIVRLVMALKLGSLGRGASGVRREIVTLIEAMLAHGIVPLVPIRGSVGSSGDLCPLAHLFATLLDQAGVDVLLVGDSVATVVQGRDTTVPVTMSPSLKYLIVESTAAAKSSAEPMSSTAT